MKAAATKSKPAIDQLETVFKALADKTRLRILALLGKNEVCVCHIHATLQVPQPTVSRHLAYLRRAGLVDARRDGVWMHYQIARTLDPAAQSVLGTAIDALNGVPTTADDRRHFQRAFGQLYVVSSPTGGSCCAPRA